MLVFVLSFASLISGVVGFMEAYFFESYLGGLTGIVGLVSFGGLTVIELHTIAHYHQIVENMIAQNWRPIAGFQI